MVAAPSQLGLLPLVADLLGLGLSLRTQRGQAALAVVRPDAAGEPAGALCGECGGAGGVPAAAGATCRIGERAGRPAAWGPRTIRVNFPLGPPCY